MAQYDVYPDRSGDGWLLDLQTDLLDGLNIRTVAPLMTPDRAPTPGRRLNPHFIVLGRRVVLVTQYLASVPEGALETPVANLSDESDAITAALDMLFHGF